MTILRYDGTETYFVKLFMCVYIKKYSLVNLKLLCLKLKTEKYGTPLLCAMQCHLHGEPSIHHVDMFNPQ